MNGAITRNTIFSIIMIATGINTVKCYYRSYDYYHALILLTMNVSTIVAIAVVYGTFHEV